MRWRATKTACSIFGGQADLRAGLLRHVSPAFVEDPLRVLRVARFGTLAFMRRWNGAPHARAGCVGGPPRWRRSASGRSLREASWNRIRHASCRLRECGALSELLPEVAALDGAGRRAKRGTARPSALLSRALEYAAQREFTLPVRYAVLAHRLGGAGVAARARAGRGAQAIQDVRCAEKISERLKVPVDCRDAARLAARWHRVVVEAPTLPPAALLDLVNAADALRRPRRRDITQTCECDAMSASHPASDFAAAGIFAQHWTS
jgi:tRNA nucleotidyltransferase (CCA-adding enzyme)